MSGVPIEHNEFRVAVCITTMHRPNVLRICLEKLSQCQPAPLAVVVSDDSREPSQIEATRQVVAQFPNVLYVEGATPRSLYVKHVGKLCNVEGPRRGVCANRNRALDQIIGRGFDYVSFVDDDTSIPRDFFSIARAHYGRLPPQERVKTLVTGGRTDVGSGAVRLNFRSYFEPAEKPESVTVCSAIFPIGLLATERWDENIFFGSEDAEICLRAAARGFRIEYCSEMVTAHLASGGGVLLEEQSSGMTKYELQCEAARLYIGIKRYSEITPNRFKLALFVSVYFSHMSVLLIRRRLLGSMVPIVKAANLGTLRLFSGEKISNG